MIKNNAGIQSFLDDVHRKTEESGKKCELLTFSDFWDRKYGADLSDFDRRSFLNDVSTLQVSNQISYYQELTSYKKGIAPVVFFFKKIIRKLVAFLFLPLVASQNSVNMAFARFSAHVRNYINREEGAKLRIRMREKELESRIELQKKQIDELTGRVNELSEKLNSLMAGGDNR